MTMLPRLTPCPPPDPDRGPLAGLLPGATPPDERRLRQAADTAIRRVRAAPPARLFGVVATPWALVGLLFLALASGFAGYYAPPGGTPQAAMSPLALLLSAPADLGAL